MIPLTSGIRDTRTHISALGPHTVSLALGAHHLKLPEFTDLVKHWRAFKFCPLN